MALNVAAYCALVNSILPGQRVDAQVKDTPETLYGSEARRRPVVRTAWKYSSRTAPRPTPHGKPIRPDLAPKMGKGLFQADEAL